MMTCLGNERSPISLVQQSPVNVTALLCKGKRLGHHIEISNKILMLKPIISVPALMCCSEHVQTFLRQGPDNLGMHVALCCKTSCGTDLVVGRVWFHN